MNPKFKMILKIHKKQENEILKSERKGRNIHIQTHVHRAFVCVRKYLKVQTKRENSMGISWEKTRIQRKSSQRISFMLFEV